MWHLRLPQPQKIKLAQAQGQEHQQIVKHGARAIEDGQAQQASRASAQASE